MIRCCIELPMFDSLDVTTGMEGIKIHYGVKKHATYVNNKRGLRIRYPFLTETRYTKD